MKFQKKSDIFLLTLLASMAFFQPVLAEIHNGRQVVGLSTEADANGLFEIADHPPGQLQLHLMVYGYTHPQGIVAWDCAVILPPGVELSAVTLMGNGTNSQTHHTSFTVITETPLMPSNGMVHLATLDLITLNGDPKDFHLAADPLWANQQHMGFSLQTSESLRMPFHWPNRCEQCPVFRITNIPQAAGTTSMDQLKAFYR